MKHNAISIRTFIGAKNFALSSSFYKELGFEEVVISEGFSYFNVYDKLGFYLQDYYAREWVENSMVFLEVDDIDRYWEELQMLCLPDKYEGVKLTPIRNDYWGRECFLHDPAGVLWHFGVFNK
jgi:catechol 2,3-dioxygenase-like lactoylglutathione lyase family enzyme